MAHWIGVINLPAKEVLTGSSKKSVIDSVVDKMRGRTKYLSSNIRQQLERSKGAMEAATAVGTEGEELVKVYSCSCGSVKKHLGGK